MSKERELLREMADVLKQQEPIVSYTMPDAFIILGRYTQIAAKAKELIKQEETPDETDHER